MKDVKKLYHQLLKKYHPDNGGGDPEETRRIIEEYKEYCLRYGKQ